MTEHYFKLSLTDICLALELPEQTFVELVRHDIVRPELDGEGRSDWSFDLTMVSVARRAVRLHRDLQLDWSAVAIIEELIQQREQLEAENELLRRQLNRFFGDTKL